MEPRDRVRGARGARAAGQDGTVIAVSGGGWGVGDVIGAPRGRSRCRRTPTVLCLCGRNEEPARTRQRTSSPATRALRVMGFTNQMSDVLAASNALIHSSAGLTVLEAIIRGCPVISYGFGYGHVRVSNQALERFKLAQVAPSTRLSSDRRSSGLWTLSLSPTSRLRSGRRPPR